MRVISNDTIVFIILSNSFFFSLDFFKIIISFFANILVWRTLYNQICKLYFFVYLITENLKKRLMYCLFMGSIVVYHTTIILNTLNKVPDYIELKIVKI